MTGQPVRKTAERTKGVVQHAELDLLKKIVERGEKEGGEEERGDPVLPPYDGKGDMNCDGEISFGDINPFVNLMTDLNYPYEEYYDENNVLCHLENQDHLRADINRDGELTFGDINPFVDMILYYQDEQYCGNYLIGEGEQCDITNLNGLTCESQGFLGGDLACIPPGHNNECGFDYFGCDQTPPDFVIFEKTFGGMEDEKFPSFIETLDGGFLLGSYTGSWSNIPYGWHFSNNLLLIKTDAEGNTCYYAEEGNCTGDGVFAKVYNLSSWNNYFYPISIHQTSDGGYVAGLTAQIWKDEYDIIDVFVVIKTDENGETCDYDPKYLNCTGEGVFVSAIYGKREPWDNVRDNLYHVLPTSDGGYIISGLTGAYPQQEGIRPIWLVKINSTGGTCDYGEEGNCIGDGVFAKIFSFSSEGDSLPTSIIETSDGGYLLSVRKWYERGSYLVKMDSDGNTCDYDLGDCRGNGVFVKEFGNDGYSQEIFDVKEVFDSSGQSQGLVSVGRMGGFGHYQSSWVLRMNEYGEACDNYDYYGSCFEYENNFSRIYHSEIRNGFSIDTVPLSLNKEGVVFANSGAALGYGYEDVPTLVLAKEYGETCLWSWHDEVECVYDGSTGYSPMFVREYSYDSGNTEYISKVIHLSDGGFAFIGETNYGNNNPGVELWFVRTDNIGSLCGDDKINHGEECDGTDDANCPGNCMSDCSCCGNGQIDPGEGCDDGNKHDCDGCKGDCSRPDNVCNDGITECGEDCDSDTGCYVGFCKDDCSCPLTEDCGNGALDEGEGCDDGNTINCDNYPGGCDWRCQHVEECGNGIKQCSEFCDDGNTIECTPYPGCNANCTAAVYCGNDIIECWEECEDSDDSACPGQCTPIYCRCP